MTMSGASPSSVDLEPVEMQRWAASSWRIKLHHGADGGASLPCAWLNTPVEAARHLCQKGEITSKGAGQTCAGACWSFVVE